MISLEDILQAPVIEHTDRMEARFELYDHVLEVAGRNKLIGLWFEFGVDSGSTINYLSRFTNFMIGFDSFEGLPEDWGKDFPKGTFNRGGKPPRVNSNVFLIRGLFEETVPKLMEHCIGDIAFAHIDCDLYSSTNTVLRNIESRLIDGAVLIFDELYNYEGFENHEFKALNEFIERTGCTCKLIARTNFEQVAVSISFREKFEQMMQVP